MRKSRRGIGTESKVEMIPLIDVVFLVLVTFIYASTFLSPKAGLPVDLPRASMSTMENTSVLVVTIDRNGMLYLDKEPVRLDRLSNAFSRASRRDGRAVVYVQADRRARIDLLVQIMDHARKAGISGLTIATRRPTESRQAGESGLR